MAQKRVVLEQGILKSNDLLAQRVREDLRRRRILVTNLLSSPGAGKTALLEALAQHLGPQMAVIVGDVQTRRDAERLERHGIQAVQIVTGGTCHLEARMVLRALEKLQGTPRFLFIENVGNLVCPAGFDLGEQQRWVLLSTPEGDDKPLKYPEAFLTSQVLVITKVDLLPHVPFQVEQAEAFARSLQPDLRIFRTSVITGEGIPHLLEYLEAVYRQLFAHA